MKTFIHILVALVIMTTAASCFLDELVEYVPGPDAPIVITTPPDSTGIDSSGIDTSGSGVDTMLPPPDSLVVCECVNDSLHFVTDPDYVSGWVQWDFAPDSVVWYVRANEWSPWVIGSNDDLPAMLEFVFPAYTWTVYDTTDMVFVLCDGTSDKDFIQMNVKSVPFMAGQAGPGYFPLWVEQGIYSGGALSFADFKTILTARPSTRGMNLRGSDFTLVQSMELWELLLQWCENRKADPNVFPVYRADFRWGLFDPEIVDRFKCRLWTAPVNFQEDPSDPYIRA